MSTKMRTGMIATATLLTVSLAGCQFGESSDSGGDSKQESASGEEAKQDDTVDASEFEGTWNLVQPDNESGQADYKIDGEGKVDFYPAPLGEEPEVVEKGEILPLADGNVVILLQELDPDSLAQRYVHLKPTKDENLWADMDNDEAEFKRKE